MSQLEYEMLWHKHQKTSDEHTTLGQGTKLKLLNTSLSTMRREV